MTISDTIKQNIRSHALEFPNSEVCGLIINGDVARCRNISTKPEKHFQISPKDFVFYSEFGNIEGYYHSHISNNSWSSFDRIMASSIKYPSILYIKPKDLFEIKEPFEDYLNRSFSLSKNDCFTLIRDYFNNEYSYNISFYNYSDNWSNIDSNIILNNLSKEKFEIIYKGHLFKKNIDFLRENDIILIGTIGDKSFKHICLYLGNNMILHHPRNGNSLVCEYDNKYKRLTKCICRRNNG